MWADAPNTMYIIPRAIVSFIMLFLLTVGYGSEIAGKIPDEINKKNAQDKWFAIDKVQHFSYSCLIALGSQYVLVNKGGMEEDSALPLSAGFSLFTGILKEILDSKSPKGFFSRRDLIADSLGIVLAVAIIFQPGQE